MQLNQKMLLDIDAVKLVNLQIDCFDCFLSYKINNFHKLIIKGLVKYDTHKKLIAWFILHAKLNQKCILCALKQTDPQKNKNILITLSYKVSILWWIYFEWYQNMLSHQYSFEFFFYYCIKWVSSHNFLILCDNQKKEKFIFLYLFICAIFTYFSLRR